MNRLLSNLSAAVVLFGGIDGWIVSPSAHAAVHAGPPGGVTCAQGNCYIRGPYGYTETVWRRWPTHREAMRSQPPMTMPAETPNARDELRTEPIDRSADTPAADVPADDLPAVDGPAVDGPADELPGIDSPSTDDAASPTPTDELPDGELQDALPEPPADRGLDDTDDLLPSIPQSDGTESALSDNSQRAESLSEDNAPEASPAVPKPTGPRTAATRSNADTPSRLRRRTRSPDDRERTVRTADATAEPAGDSFPAIVIHSEHPSSRTATSANAPSPNVQTVGWEFEEPGSHGSERLAHVAQSSSPRTARVNNPLRGSGPPAPARTETRTESSVPQPPALSVQSSPPPRAVPTTKASPSNPLRKSN